MNFISKFQNVSFGRKLFVAIAIFVAPTILLGYFAFSEKIQIIRGTEREIKGVVYLKVAHLILMTLQADDMVSENIGQLSQMLMQTDQQDNGAMGATKTAEDLSKRIAGVASGKDPSGPLVKTADFVHMLADKSGIVLDPDIDAHYLGNVLVEQLTTIALKSNDMASAADDLSHNEKSADFQINFAVAREEIEGVGAGFSDNLQNAIKGNADGTLEPALKQQAKEGQRCSR